MVDLVAIMCFAVKGFSAHCETNMRLGPEILPPETRTANLVAFTFQARLVGFTRLGAEK
jgi:hypothetical protein